MSIPTNGLGDLPVESIDVLPADTVEVLEAGHGMTEIAASSSTSSFGSCLKAEFDDPI
ncbi:hypothetical protein NE236_18390 [Actinoallomurus purpureus]|uniref:thiomuracin/GE37468 family thiazolyl RiPP peptide n=1 Tax=Actinoallomurus purpureus TaxID=478114 RepID=UPI002091F530|nr:thiomuracin/GE37468 family thiazolyl RiPP peptide [Actinoallomurus purpureus]MCO6006959.1 hypothetical protein [Actinoallomurus purpureus]